MLGRLEDVDEEIKKNLEKIIGLEEVHAIQQEKAVYVESLASRVSAMDEHKQMVSKTPNRISKHSKLIINFNTKQKYGAKSKSFV